MNPIPRLSLTCLFLASLLPATLRSADWPMWRHDASRSAATNEKLPEKLHLQWSRDLLPSKPAFWQIRQERVQFDLGYEPVVMGQTLFVASSTNDSLTAFDTSTGQQRWRFYADAPIRLAPVAFDAKLYFASDDGHLYCLDAASGKLLWKVRAVPSNRRILGNGRLISVWPCRGGPVILDNRLYFAAGVWPFEGIFVHALDPRTGQSLWINDRCGSLYADHPHAAPSFGGPSPQGYLLVHDGKLVMPSSRAFPAHFDLASGRLLAFDFGHGGHGSQPGSWFVATDDQNRLCVDPNINTEIHDEGKQVIGQRGIRKLPDEVLQSTVKVGQTSYQVIEASARTIHIAGKPIHFDDGFPGVEGTIHTMLAADGKLFVVNRAARLYCFGPQPKSPQHHPLQRNVPSRSDDAWAARAKSILQITGIADGHALLLGLGTGRLAEELAAQSNLQIIALDPDPAKIDNFRRQMDQAGLYGSRITALPDHPLDANLPPYFASLIACEDLKSAAFATSEKWLSTIFNSLRPFGGTLCLETSDAQHHAISASLKSPLFPGATLKREAGHTLIIRGPLPGAANYTGQPSFDQLVKAPLGVLWFGDTLHHHKLFYQGYAHEGGRGLPPYIHVVDGVMSYTIPKEPIELKDKSIPYLGLIQRINTQPHQPAYTDIYTGRLLASGPPDPATTPPAQQSESLSRKNPITGLEESREFSKTFGCDQIAADYGHLITMRSGTAAFYDKRSESGTINISGTRSGCRNSMVAAGGILSMPAWTGNCTCNYPVFTSMALVAMPPRFEQWSAWGPIAVDAPIQRVGINFGAPGDRIAPDGTLWLDFPSVGGPSPDVRVLVSPASAEPFYHHALRTNGGQGWPWVFASGIRGPRSISIDTTAHAPPPAGQRFSVRWTGQLLPPTSDDYTLHVRGDGPIKVILNGQTIVDSSLRVAKDGLREASAKVTLTAKTLYDLRVEYKHTDKSPAQAELSWSTPTLPRSTIPAVNLLTTDTKPGRLAAAYFANDKLTGAALLQIEHQIKHTWGNSLPAILNARPLPKPQDRAYTVRLTFAEPDSLQPGQRVFSIKLQGKEVLKDFDIIKEAGVSLRGVVREFPNIHATDSLLLELTPSTTAPPVISGIELIAQP